MFSTDLENGFYCSYGFVVPKLTSRCDRILIVGFNPVDPEDLDEWMLYKILCMSYEIRLCEDYYNKDIIIVDSKNLTLNHLTKFSLPGIKKAIHCGQVSRILRLFISMSSKCNIMSAFLDVRYVSYCLFMSKSSMILSEYAMLIMTLGLFPSMSIN